MLVGIKFTSSIKEYREARQLTDGSYLGLKEALNEIAVIWGMPAWPDFRHHV